MQLVIATQGRDMLTVNTLTKNKKLHKHKHHDQSPEPSEIIQEGEKQIKEVDKYCTKYKTQSDCSSMDMIKLSRCGTSSNRTILSSFAVIGDYGFEGNCQIQIHRLLKVIEEQYGVDGGPLDFIFTTGDNNYWGGGCDSFQTNIGNFYYKYFPKSNQSCVNPIRTQKEEKDNLHSREHIPDLKAYEDIKPKLKPIVPKKNVRFFPSLGNHDWKKYSNVPDKLPYLQYFSYLRDYSPHPLSHGQFYTVLPNPFVQLFSVNSNLGLESDPLHKETFKIQMQWLEDSLRISNAPFKFVFFHHPPFSTARHDPPAKFMEYPYEEWGATAIFTGHQHVYERIVKGNPAMTYIINGLGGHPWIYDIHDCIIEQGSQVRYNSNHGILVGVLSRSNSITSESPFSNWKRNDGSLEDDGRIGDVRVGDGRDRDGQGGDSRDSDTDFQIDMCFYSLEGTGQLVDHFHF